MASSAIYRYFASRDDLLTALIIEAYNDLGQMVEDADERVANRQDLAARWLAICRALRDWALANPHQWALIYGTPIQNYSAPEDTIGAATRATGRMMSLLIEASTDGASDRTVRNEVGLRSEVGLLSPMLYETVWGAAPNLREEQVVEGVGAWAQVIGLVTLELFGHLNNVIADRDGSFTQLVVGMGDRLGVRAPSNSYVAVEE